MERVEFSPQAGTKQSGISSDEMEHKPGESLCKLPFPARQNLDHRCGEIVKSQPRRYVKVLEGGERELTDGFTRFMLHYHFRAEFCNPAAGNEKGSVENRVGYSRHNAFVPVPTVTSFEEFNEWLGVLFTPFPQPFIEIGRAHV